MAPVLFTRDHSVAPNGLALSTSVIVGIAVVAAAAAGLVVFLSVKFLRRKRRRTLPAANSVHQTLSRHSSLEKEPLPADLQALHPATPFVRSVAQRNLTPSIIMPIPASRDRPSKGIDSADRSLSAADIIAHHGVTGTMPRAFAPVPAPKLVPAPAPAYSPTPSTGQFSLPLNLQTSPRSSAQAPTSPSFHTANSRPGSITSFSRFSFLTASLRGASLRASVSSKSSASTTAAESLKVHHVFTPLLPDELVLRRGERVTLVRAYDDGWCVVGRRAPWAAKAATQYAFGHPTTHTAPGGVELGAAPAWVFRKASGAHDRPMRSASLGVTLTMEESERREEVVSWSNF